ncbi:hypothetical protein M0R04_10925 [Candidatus Dojkabacteria bacterium]|jgi:hypothetical protein|nr:hypothetical protein [Candidatus Dojkabacteria bacterium]
MPKETTNALLKELIGEIKSLKEELKPKEGPRVEPVKEETKPEEGGPTIPASAPVPTEYREVVKTVLNDQFGVKVIPLADRPAFQLEITVPQKYSNATKEYIETYGGDLRSRVVDYAQGSNGVRDWCETVYKNLGAEIQALIVSDRNK